MAFKLAPGRNNQDQLTSFHKLDSSLRIFRFLGAFNATFDISEDAPILGGDRRLYRQGLPKASWGGERILRCGLEAVFAYVNFDPLTDLDAPVTLRTWNKNVFADYSATLQYLPASDQDSNEAEISPWLLSFIDLVAL